MGVDVRQEEDQKGSLGVGERVEGGRCALRDRKGEPSGMVQLVLV